MVRPPSVKVSLSGTCRNSQEPHTPGPQPNTQLTERQPHHCMSRRLCLPHGNTELYLTIVGRWPLVAVRPGPGSGRAGWVGLDPEIPLLFRLLPFRLDPHHWPLRRGWNPLPEYQPRRKCRVISWYSELCARVRYCFCLSLRSLPPLLWLTPTDHHVM
jgi:hypothetical protein